jgi:hypothetical protein
MICARSPLASATGRSAAFLQPVENTYDADVRLTAGVKLEPSLEQAHALMRTLRRANAAANAMSLTAWRKKVFT